MAAPHNQSAPSHSAWPRRQYRAPDQSGGLLVAPDGRTPLSLLTSNRLLLEQAPVSIGKESLAQLRRACRRDVLRNACEYTARIRGVRPEMPSLDDDLVVVGHQPGLFHPGVWLKHWTAAAIAKRSGGIALNVVVDNDLCESIDVAVPTESSGAVTTGSIPLDNAFEPRPWEDVRVKDPGAFRSAGERLCEGMRDWGYEPIACQAWAEMEQVEQCDSLVDHLTRIRHRTQMAAGVEMFEVPMRNVARLPAFAQFVAFIVQNIATVSAVYNEGLAIYRRLNKLRNDAHPMPNMAREGNLFEVPLWVWRAGDNQRRPLWARLDGCGVRLFDRDADGELNAIAFVRDGECEWDQWHRMLTDLDHQGYRVRPRALMTTLFLRLCLADLFIHGIGGAKYDEVTDWIIRQFVGMKPPEFLTVSGTFRLPIASRVSDGESLAQLQQRRRDMIYNPDRHGATGPLVDEKEMLVAEQREAADGNGQQRQNLARYRRIREINESLRSQIEAQMTALDDQIAAAKTQARTNRTLASREYSWVLFPSEELMSSLGNSANAIAGGVVVGPHQ